MEEDELGFGVLKATLLALDIETHPAVVAAGIPVCRAAIHMGSHHLQVKRAADSDTSEFEVEGNCAQSVEEGR
jgi:L-lactate permease